MTRYRIDDVSFDRPPAWRDATTACFAARRTSDGPPPPTIAMWREPLAEGESLLLHTQRVMARFSREAAGFTLAFSGDTVVAGRAASVLRFRFDDATGPVDQTMVIVDHGADPDRMLTIFSAASRAETAEAAYARLAEVLASVAFEVTAAPPSARP